MPIASNVRNLRLLTAALLGLLLIDLILSWFLWPVPLVDDAFIGFRYAFHLSRQGEFVFNLGERVEGTTNLLWVLLLAGADRLGADIQHTALVLGAAIYVICGLRLTRLAAVMVEPALAILVVILCLPLGGTFGRLALDGMETGFYAWLLTECFIAFAARRTGRLGLLCGLLFMVRPEGAGVGLLFALAALVHRRDKGQVAFQVLAGMALFIVPVTLFRLVYFGGWIPNSVLAKSYPWADVRAAQRSLVLPYLLGFAGTQVQLALPALAAAGLLMRSLWSGRLRAALAEARGREGHAARRVRMELAALAVIGFSIVVTMRNGGDWMPFHRLLLQYLPAYVVLAAAFVRQVRWAMPAMVCLALGVAVPAVAQLRQPACCSLWRDERFATDPDWRFWRDAADRLAPILKPDDRIATEAAGYIPYRLPMTPVHDPLGLLDPYLARHGHAAMPFGKSDMAYTLGTVRPSFLVWHYAGHLAEGPPGTLAKLRTDYVAFCHSRCADGAAAHIVMVRRDRLDAQARAAFAGWPLWDLDRLKN